jgi:hypothetical protein
VTVGVVAVDPTSPFTGGAILGDRIRMREHDTDPGFYMRSMATRGSLAGRRDCRGPGARHGRRRAEPKGWHYGDSRYLRG